MVQISVPKVPWHKECLSCGKEKSLVNGVNCAKCEEFKEAKRGRKDANDQAQA